MPILIPYTSRIILLTSPNAFASLIVLNRKWRAVSQQAHLYTHHLSRCASYSAAHPSSSLLEYEHNLPKLRRIFAREIKRNLFEAYLRPRETVISLVSTSISSSSAPGGEAFHFSISPKGHFVLAYSSSRIHVLDVRGPVVEVKRELKILRRPASATITDDGSLLAILATDLQVDIYDLTRSPPKHTHAVALDHSPRTIALSPTGSVLAAAYDSGVEVSSLDSTNSNTERRAVKCYAADTLCFSKDGTQLLGSTMQSRNPSTVILTAPYYNTGGAMPDETLSISALWTTSILFPNGSRDCSHAVLLPSASDEEASWAFTYDRVFETFRAVRIDDLRNGTTYFTGPLPDATSGAKLLPSTLPTSSQRGDLVASGFQGSIWLYGVPEDLDAVPVISYAVNGNTDSGISTPSTQLGRRNSAPSLRSVHRHRDASSRTPQWQLLCDRFRNTFVEGRKISTLDQVSAMSWVRENDALPHDERLVAVAPGIGLKRLSRECWEDDGMSPVDGGRISILDFGYAVTDGTKSTITIEVGNKEPEVLEEEHRDLDTEVAIVRRRTVAQRRGNRSHVSHSDEIVPHMPHSEPPPLPTHEDVLGDPYAAPPLVMRRLSDHETASERMEDPSMEEVQEALDAPYSHTSPRSGTTLRRAATAAAVNRRLHPRAVAQDHIEYRRADGREEHPHESDADNWVPPPPPYSKDPLPPLPEHIQRSLLAEAAQSGLAITNRIDESHGLDITSLNRSHTVASTSTSRSRHETFPFQRSVSDFTTMNSDRVSIDEDRPRPSSSPGSPDFDDLYDVSPQGTPPLTPHMTATQQIPRRPVRNPTTNDLNQNSNSEMRATLLEPVSPLPLPSPSPLSDYGEIQPNQEVTTGGPVKLPSHMETSTVSFHTDVPPTPAEEHHLTQMTTPMPVARVQQQVVEPQISISPEPSRFSAEDSVVPGSIALMSKRVRTAPTSRSSIETDEDPIMNYRRSDTAPTPSVRPANTSNSGGTMHPSADLLARLNSRQGRPQGIADPSRRVSSGSNSQPRRSSSGNRSASSLETSQHRSSYRKEQTSHRNSSPERMAPPRAAVGAYGSPSRNSVHGKPNDLGQLSPQTGNSPQHLSGSQTSNRGSPGLRPSMQRLETIQSITSNSEPTPFIPVRSNGITRNPSRAERSAARNIQNARKKGWRQSIYGPKKAKTWKKDKYGDTASSAGWTDVTYGSPVEEQKKSGKCTVM
jgi:hypothetical protein